jgi:hypothetical protein
MLATNGLIFNEEIDEGRIEFELTKDGVNQFDQFHLDLLLLGQIVQFVTHSNQA